MEPDIKSCPNYEETTYDKCSKYKELGLNSDCLQNDKYNKLCTFREGYYKLHPETYIQFGKYKYYEYENLPDSYIAWLLKQDIKEDLKECLFNAIIKNYKEKIIQQFIDTHYSVHSKSYSYSKCTDWYNPDLDYGGDLFDAMRGCGLNGD